LSADHQLKCSNVVSICLQKRNKVKRTTTCLAAQVTW